jgi:uncharacterized protein YegP (UPF0339 family)
MAGFFQLKTASNAQWMFNLKAGNHETILTSESYSSKAGAQAGIESVRKNAPADSNYERNTASNGSPFFVLKAANGQALGRSEVYSSLQAMEGGVASVKANAPDAAVKEI